MGFFKRNEEEIRKNLEKLNDIINPYLLEGEEIEFLHGIPYGFTCMTNKRLLFVEKTLGNKTPEVVTVPYSKIESIAIEKDKPITLANELIVYTKHKEHKLIFPLNANIVEFYNALAMHII